MALRASLRPKPDVTVENDEIRGMSPEPVVGEPKRIAVVIGREHHIAHEQDWGR